MATAAQISIIKDFTFDEESHLYSRTDGRKIWSVTQVLADTGFISYEHVKQETLEWKSSLGVAVHKATEFVDRDELDWDTLAEEAVPYVLAYEKFVRENQFVPELIEHRGAVELRGMAVGYQCDRVGKCGNFPVIIDLKCCSAMPKSCRYQLAAYDLCLKAEGRKPEGQPFWKRIGLLLKPDGTYAMSGPYDNPRHRDIFMCALAVTVEKFNEGITK